MSTPLRPPLAKSTCKTCRVEIKGRRTYCAECRLDRDRAAARRRMKRKRAGPEKHTIVSRLERIEAMLAQLVAVGGRAA